VDARPIGVIEGYYGTPWTFDERARCIDELARHGGNAYVWAPKSEPRHRDRWDEPFTADELDGFASLANRSPDVMVSVGLTPGAQATVDQVAAKVHPVLESGCKGVTLCFDDLPVLEAATHHRTLANHIAEDTGVAVWVVPTHYAGHHGSPYLDALLDGLRDDILVMWTGEHVVNDTITADTADARRGVTADRAPLLWDNTPVNDALMTSLLHIGPYIGRDDDLRDSLSGLLINPMESLTASLPTLMSALAWWHGRDAEGAWASTVDELGLRLLAEATAFPGDPHWPGHSPSAEWLAAVAEMSDDVDPYLQPWVAAARHGARVCLAALALVEDVSSGEAPSSLARRAIPMLGLDAWLRTPVRTLGSGPRNRPVWTQDGAGEFAPTAASIELTSSIPEYLVAQALDAWRASSNS
jgi:hypothetical protein